MISQKTARILVAEFTGTMILLATVIGSGIMAERLAGGNVAIALLGNTIPTGAILYVLITVFGPVSGAHFNPAVTIAFLLRREIAFTRAAHFMFVQVAGAICGAMLAHFMFEVPLLQL
ncbi:MAG: aquaporin, partial [Pseudomonadota bacterium]|nr:aquaporin [Pseudomonadota bacterium]